MAASIDIVRTVRGKSGSLGDIKLVIADLTFVTDAYATGGVAITAAALGLTSIDGILNAGDEGTTNYLWSWIPSTGKLAAFNTGTDGATYNEAGADVITGQALRILAIGY